MKRRLRATFLLKLVVAIASLAVVALAVALLAFHPLTLGTVVAVVVFWFLAFELELLSALVETLVLRRAARSPRTLDHSLWFVDVEAASQLERDRVRKATENNPTVR